MSELIQKTDSRATIRWKLLTGASALALTTYMSATGLARADDVKQPVLWLELGGQFQQLTDPSEKWVPGNLPPVIDHPVTGILGQSPRIGYDANGKLTLHPADTDWNFSVAIQYGKAKKGPKYAHDQTYKSTFNGQKYVRTTYAFTDMHTVEETKHLILDFTAGKDVGLGLFGGRGSAAVNFGIRIAQFSEHSDGTQTAQISAPAKYSVGNQLNAYLHSDRSFKGIGPSVAWSGSVPIAGSMEDGLAIDWGVNGSLLFGRQKTKIKSHTEEKDFVGFTYVYTGYATVPYAAFSQVTHSTASPVRSKTVTVPNLGGMIGMSFRKGNAKISFGYKADFFFGAIDGGIATAKKENRGFYGPFASISIGIGD